MNGMGSHSKMASSAPATVAIAAHTAPEVRAVYVEVLRGMAEPRFLPDLQGAERRTELASARALVCWDWSRELRNDELGLLSVIPFVQLLSAGADHVRLSDLPPDTLVASNAGAYAEPMAEHVLAMALALAKRLPQRQAELSRGEFNQRSRARRFAGSVCGVLGLGGIGRATARLMRALGARIQAINTTGRTAEAVEFVGTLADLDRVLESADVLVISLPLTRETSGLIGRRELELMKPEAILINVARGAIVQEAALFEHLRSHPEFCAGLDVWWREPRGHGKFETAFPFFELRNFLGSPHNSANVDGIETVAARRAAENVLRHLRGEPVTGLLKRADYEPS